MFNPGGGSGWYGGGSSGVVTALVGTGAGGSSFISGHVGCVAIKAKNDRSPKTGSAEEICVHYSGKVFSATEMIDGVHSMPKPDGTGNETGHTGDGFCRITGTSTVP